MGYDFQVDITMASLLIKLPPMRLFIQQYYKTQYILIPATIIKAEYR